jgi:hypothetical protein
VTLLVHPHQRVRLMLECLGPQNYGMGGRLRESPSLWTSRRPVELSYPLARCIEGVNVIPTNNPSGAKNRLTICPQGSFLFLTSIR